MTGGVGSGPVGVVAPTLESARHVRGRGQFIADVQLPRMLHVAFVRSPHAHARIVDVDMAAAARMPGVHATLTGAEAVARSGPIFTLGQGHDPPLAIPLYCLAHDKARYAGEAVAAVAATSRARAEDAAARVRVEYEPLPAVLDAEQALRPGATLVHDGVAGNRIMHRRHDFGDVDGVFARAATCTRRTLRWPRQTGAALDTIGCVAQWDEAAGGVTIWSNHQAHGLIATLGATLGVPSHRVRSIVGDIGGSFGAKFWQPRPLVVCALISRATGRPVRFVEDRAEHLEAGDNHGEDRVYDVQLALDEGGRMRGLRLAWTEDYGAYFVLGALNASEPLCAAVGPYGIEAVGIDYTAVLTNKTAQAAYRGFGSGALNFALERIVDLAALELELDRVEIRRRNLLRPAQLPYRTPIGNLYDSGDYPRALQTALDAADVEGWRARQREARAEGRAIGIGLATCQDRSVQTGTASWLMYDQRPGRGTSAPETATIRIDGEGNVRVGLHSPSPGTAQETVAATVAAAELGVTPERVLVARVGSDLGGPAGGASASRLTVMLAGAVAGAAAQLKRQLVPLAAQELRCDVEAVEWVHEPRGFRVAGDAARHVGLDDLARLANTAALTLPDGMRSGLEATYTYDHPLATMPKADGSDWGIFAPIMGHAVHVPIVEVDVGTGTVRFLQYTVVHDAGTVMNPDAVRGQVIGGIAQGIASALAEELSYDEAGRLRQRDLRSYFMPTALDVPAIDVLHVSSPSPFTWRGLKGVGEGGRVVAPVAVVSAVEDALAPWGARLDSLPVTPERVIDAIAAHTGAADPR